MKKSMLLLGVLLFASVSFSGCESDDSCSSWWSCPSVPSIRSAPDLLRMDQDVFFVSVAQNKEEMTITLEQDTKPTVLVEVTSREDKLDGTTLLTLRAQSLSSFTPGLVTLVISNRYGSVAKSIQLSLPDSP